MFFSFETKNLNRNSTKFNLVTFKRLDEVKKEKF